MLEFYWKKHLIPDLHVDRLNAFHAFFNYDPQENDYSSFFTILPEKCDIGPETIGISSRVHPAEDEEEIFSSSRIFLKIPQMCYQANKEVDTDFINARKAKSMVSEHGAKVLVEHYFSMKTMHLLFTKTIGEKFVRHLVQSLEIQKYRKGKHYKLSKQAEQAIANSPSHDIQHLPITTNKENHKSKPAEVQKIRARPSNAPIIELLVVISIDMPQINIQNELKKSQAVITTGERISILIYDTFIKEQSAKYWIQKTVWVYIPHLLCYVAPTNLYKREKTMWLDIHPGEDFSRKQNLMEMIMSANDNEVMINAMNPEFYDYLRPMMSLDIKINDVKLMTDSTNWWKFMDVLDAFIFDRGIKQTEEETGEKLKHAEVSQFQNELLTNIIYQNLTKVLFNRNFIIGKGREKGAND